MADVKYEDSTPVDEPVAKAKQKAKPTPPKDKKPAPASADMDMGMGYAKGGSASSRADGCAQRGKTRGMML
tara:strand:+ start:812 stop:1024 length:213 start_codon:yes stop_codon:yes gene_type:complete